MGSSSELDLREGLTTVTHGTVLLVVATFLFVLFSFLARVLLVRNLSPDEWSAFSIGFTLAGVLAAIGTLGLTYAVPRSLPHAASDNDRRTIVRAAFGLGAGSAAVTAIALGVAAPFVGSALGSGSIGFGLRFFAVATGCAIAAAVVAAVFQGFADVVPNAVFVQVMNPALFLAFLSLGFVIPGLAITYSEALVAYIAAAGATLATLAAYAVGRLRRHLPAIGGPKDPQAREVRHDLFRFAAPLFVVGAMASLQGSGDTLVLGAIRTSEVGTYTASLALARLVQVGIGATSYIFLPVAARFLRRGDRSAVRLTYATVTKWIALFSLPLVLLFAFLPGPSLGFVYGGTYSRTILPLQLTVVGAFGATLLGPAVMAQVAFGHGRLLAVYAAVAATVDVGVALLLVPRWGFVGAATAWAAATFLYPGLCLVGLALTERLHPFRRDFVVPLVATALPIGLALAAFHPTPPWWSLPGIGLGFAGVFVLAVVATRSVGEGDRLLLDAVEKLLGRPIPIVRRVGRWVVRSRSPP